MKIVVKPLSSKEFDLEVNPECDVEHLKQLIERRCMITTVQQRLVHQGKTMSDGSTLSSYNLKDGSKVHLFTKKAEEGKKLSQLDVALVNVLKPHLAREDIDRVVAEFHRELQAAFVNYSLDDIEKLAVNLLG